MGTLILKYSALNLFPPPTENIQDYATSLHFPKYHRAYIDTGLRFLRVKDNSTQPLTSRREVSGINEHISRVAGLVVHIVGSEAKRRVRPSQSQLLVKNKTDVLMAKNKKIRSLLRLSSGLSQGLITMNGTIVELSA